MEPAAASPKLAIVIPCYRVKDHIAEVVRGLPPMIDLIVAVDDCCPQRSGEHLKMTVTDPRLRVLFHKVNQGVGGATLTGYVAAMKEGAEILVKMDGDGQMDAQYLPRLLQPLWQRRADFTKGNRFFDLVALRQMPLVRRVGNFGLTLLTKAASGYWHISDPTNGYTAVHAAALRLLNLDRLHRRYFFETSMLIQLNIVRAVAYDVPIPARYGNETSSLQVSRVLMDFPPKLVGGFCQRLLWRYFIFDVSAVSFLLVCGVMLTAFGVGFGSFHWFLAGTRGVTTDAGTVGIAIMVTIVGIQMLLQAVLLDTMAPQAETRPVNASMSTRFLSRS